MLKYRLFSSFLLLVLLLLGFFIYKTEVSDSKYSFKYGLDLNGGTELVYKADTSNVSDESGSMDSLREVIERRVNLFGVSEPVVQVVNAGIVSGVNENRLHVELPGITDIQEAVALIGKTPELEFRLVREEAKNFTEEELTEKSDEEIFLDTGLGGRYLERAQLQFTTTGSNQLAGQPIVAITFNSEGKDLFAKITRENIGEILAIFLDGKIISAPVIQDEITDGRAVISGQFTAEEARTLVRDLNYGALPVPVELISTQTIGASLGENAKTAGVKAGIFGIILVFIFLVLYYRLPGLVSGVALLVYVVISLSLFKLIPVTLTAAGIAGFILSIGMAVDANILIFERIKEEILKGKDLVSSIQEGFGRAWLSIRDSNISSIITATVLFWLGTSAIKGFALTFGLGVLVSMFTAITVSRTLLLSIIPKSESRVSKFLFGSGFHF